MNIRRYFLYCSMEKPLRSFISILSITALFGSSVSYGQSDSSYVLKGTIKNFNETYFEILQIGYLFDKEYNVVIDKSGKFSLQIPIEGIQNFLVYLDNRSIQLFAVPGDTIMLTWNENDALNTFEAHAARAGRDVELNYLTERFKSRLKKQADSEQQVKVTDSMKFSKSFTPCSLRKLIFSSILSPLVPSSIPNTSLQVDEMIVSFPQVCWLSPQLNIR